MADFRPSSPTLGVSRPRLVPAVMVCGLLLAGAARADLVAFTGKDANFNDEFAFVAISTIPNGTVIYFTNYDWDNTTGEFNTSTTEGTLEFTATASIPTGTVIHVVESAPDTYTVTGSGTAVHVSGTWAAVSADPHYAFAASNPGSPLDSVTEIYAYMDTDLDVAVGGVKDPRIGTNASPDAVVVDFSGTQPVGADFVGNRSKAGLGNLTNQAYYVETFSTTDLTLDLTAFTGLAAGAIFADDFELGTTDGWSASVP